MFVQYIKPSIEHIRSVIVVSFSRTAIFPALKFDLFSTGSVFSPHFP